MPKFTHLHLHSHFSLLDGLGKIDDILKAVKELGMDKVALTDHGNVYGAIEFYKKAKKAGIKPILGVELYVAPNGMLNKRPKIDEERYHITFLAQNETGWKNILKMTTEAHLSGFYYKPRIDNDFIEQHTEGVICLSGCMFGELSQMYAKKKFAEAEALALRFKKAFGENYFLEIQTHMGDIEKEIIKLSKKTGIPLVATHDVHYIHEEDKMAHETLLAVQTSNKGNTEKKRRITEYDLSLKSPEAMAKLFKHAPEAIENAEKIAEMCNVEIELGKIRLPRFDTPDGSDSFTYLKKLIDERISKRFSEITPTIQERLDMELGVIEKTNFADYFLIVQDYISWAREHGIVVGPGRGSAAGSLISYILGITDLDPITYDLYFERFLNPSRIQAPDIDVDFADTRRDEVVSYVREKYGNDRVAQIITFGTMMAKAAIRDTGRALGFSYDFCDGIAKQIQFNTTIEESVDTVPELKDLYRKNADAKKLIDFAKRLEGCARHASVHACGVVVSPEPLTNFMALQKAPQGEDSVITQFEGHGVEDMGLLKMDFLGLKNLSIIEGTIRLIKDIYGETIDMSNIPLNDPKAFKVFQDANTTGVFQLESSGMKRYLKELKPTELEDIIAMVALYRPGPMELIPSYINRKHGNEEVTYLHPQLEPILKNTYGVGVYQEQMMRIARDLAGYTLSEADTLRKAIGKKIKELLDEQKEKLISGMMSRGIREETAKEIWELFPPFARYGFNRSHAACYAMISYQTAYLKGHYPVEFMASLLNISGTDIDRLNFLIGEAQKDHIKVLPPDVNISSRDFSPDKENVRFGLGAIKNIGTGIVDAIIEERERGGSFENIFDLLTRVRHKDMNKKSLESLIKSGALDSLGTPREIALGNLEELLLFSQNAKAGAQSNQSGLFGTKTFTTMKLKPAPQIPKETILGWEKELLGIYLTDHPFKAYESKTKGKVKSIKEILETPKAGEKSAPMLIAGIVMSVQKIITKKGKPMAFVKIEDATQNIELLVFTETLKKTETVWNEGNAIIAKGFLTWKNDETKFIIDDARVIAM